MVAGQPIFATPGTSQGATLSACPTLTSSHKSINIAMNGGAATMITLTGYATDTTWAALVADINAAIVTAGSALSGLMAYFVPTNTAQTAGYILLVSSTVGASSSVAVTAGTSNDCSALLGFTTPTQTAGTADSPWTSTLTANSEILFKANNAGVLSATVDVDSGQLYSGQNIPAGQWITLDELVLCLNSTYDFSYSVNALVHLKLIAGVS